MGPIESKSPSFARFVKAVCQRSPLQKKAVNSFLKDRDDMFWQRAQDFSDKMFTIMKRQGIEITYAADAYLRMCADMLKEQIKFKRTGKYSCQSADQANLHIYSSEKEMASYMYGLALSQFLWPNHYSMYDFFVQESRKLSNVCSYLEVGPGHGLFLVESIHNFPEANFLAVDISPVSKTICELIITHFTGSSKCEFQVKDINHIEHGKYDFIVMCEVLEHLDEPLATMKKVHSLLNDDGHFFITTCANCPAIDHVYLYDSIDQIRKEIKEGGFQIVSDLPLAVGDYREDEWFEKKVEVNYASMLQKA